MTDLTDDQLPHTAPITIWDEPAKIAAYIKGRKQTPQTENSINTPTPYNFADFVGEVGTTDFDDVYQIRATLESQAHILGTAFQYLMMEGDWKNLEFILKTQKTMRDTIALLNDYPPLKYYAADRETYAKLNTPPDNGVTNA